jgi:hypothetical protein
MRFRVVAPIVDSGPPPTVWRRGKWVLRTGRLSPADKGVNMKLEAPWGRGLSISMRVAILYALNDFFSCSDLYGGRSLRSLSLLGSASLRLPLFLSSIMFSVVQTLFSRLRLFVC